MTFKYLPMCSPAKIGALCLFATLLVLTGCRALRVEHPRATQPSDWLTEGRTAQRAGAVPATLQPPLERAWTADADAGFGAASPLLLGDAVLVATRKGEVLGFEMHEGERLGRQEFGEAIEGTPVVADGVLVVPVEWGRRVLVGYDLHRARRLWDYRGEPVQAGLAARNGRVVAADLRGMVRLLEARSGEEVWSRPGTGAGVYGAPLVADDQIVVVDERGSVRSLAEEDGTDLWRHDLDAPVLVSPSATDSLVVLSTTRGRIIALDLRDGSRRWHHAHADSIVRFTTAALGERRAYVGATDGLVRALNLGDGHVAWQTDVAAAVSAPPLLTGDVLYVGTMGRRLMALDAATGEVLWEYELEGRIKAPMASRGGQLVVLSEPKNVYMFRVTDDALAAEE